jgi:hypothetical protein
MVCSTLLQVTGVDKLTLEYENLLLGSARISFMMQSRVHLLKLSPKVFQRKYLQLVTIICLSKFIMLMFNLSLNGFISAKL